MPKQKHLEWIQAVITRLAGNSFQMKAWNIALATAAIGFAAAKDGHPKAAMLAIIPSLVLWLLDAYYLNLEREFRDLYAEVAADRVCGYSMKTTPRRAGWRKAFGASSVLLIHLAILLAVVGATAIPW
jgi:hypothetical protein